MATWFPWHRLAVNERIAAPILLREIGVMNALRVGRAIRRQERAGEPFAALDPAVDERERQSRAQIGPAILLYQQLAPLFGTARALQVTELVVVEAALDFLRHTIGPLRREQLAAMGPAQLEAFSQGVGDRFFNATVQWEKMDADGVDFTVTACQFPRLCAAVGVPELAPVFCKGDERFFGEVESDVVLIRPQTIATGGANCPFSLRFAER